jgi:parallel beta-helix repeat protein
MLHRAIHFFRRLGPRSQKIFGGLVRAALRLGIREVAEGLPVVGAVTLLIQELAGYGAERLADIGVEVPGLKEEGEAWDPEQIDAIDRWLGDVSESLETLQRQLEETLKVTVRDSWERIAEAVARAFEDRHELAAELTAVQKRLRQQTLSLHRIERHLSKYFQVQKGARLSLEEIKAFLVESPLATEWFDFRRADPEGVRLLNEADELILEGRRDEGEKRLIDLLRRRGIGTTVIARHLGLCKLECGKVELLTELLEESCGLGILPLELTATIVQPTTHRSRPSGPSWPSLPRGFVVGRKYRIEEEVGRGGMASVYRAVGVDRIQQGKVFALKVPAPGVVDDGAAADRFVHEIQLSMQLSDAVRRAEPRPPIVATLDYVVFDDPGTGRELYGLVLEFIEGKSLARLLAERRAARRPLTSDEIRHLLTSVGAALEFAHGQTPPLLHRDVKSANVMVTPDQRALLMDFGIGRLLDDRPGHLTHVGHVMGTPDLMPPELFDRQATLDERADIYMTGKLLQEMMTFSSSGDPETRIDCPPTWIDLIADATNQIKGKRPRTIQAFLKQLGKSANALPPGAIVRKPLIVDCRGRGDFASINEAIDVAPPGTCILVRPGLYRESLRIRHAVELVGQGPREQIIVETEGGPTLRMTTSHATVRGLTLRSTLGLRSKRFFAVDVQLGRLLLEDCAITSGSLAAVGVHGVHADPLFRGCTLQSSQGTGIVVFEHGHGTYKDCIISSNACSGIRITKAANPTFIACTIRDNGANGICVADHGRGTFIDCEVAGNRLAGIEVQKAGNPLLQRCRLGYNGGVGALVRDEGMGTFETCDLADNACGTWSVEPGCLVTQRMTPAGQ